MRNQAVRQGTKSEAHGNGLRLFGRPFAATGFSDDVAADIERIACALIHSLESRQPQDD